MLHIMNLLRICSFSVFILMALGHPILTFAQSAYIDNNTKDILKHIKYIFTYSNTKDKSILNVSLEFKSGPEERTTIKLPSHFGRVSELYKNITDLTAVGARIKKTENPSMFELYHLPNQNIILNYNVKQGWSGSLVDFKHFHAPIFQKNYFQFIGNGVLIYPQSYADKKKVVFLLDWKIPDGWAIANSYGDNIHQQIIANLDDLLSGLFISGNYKYYKIQVKGGAITTAIRGKWPFQGKEFSETATTIINNERAFWNDYNYPCFLVSLIPVKTNKQGMTGTGFKNAFATALKSSFYPGKPIMSYVISHEAFHTWNKPDIFDITDETAVYYYWFSEGFTDYYANLLNLRIGLITIPDYVNQYNKTLVDYYSSSVNSSTIEKVKENFWNDLDTQKLPYQQGVILANNWNAQIKKGTNDQYSLDNLMRAFILFAKNTSKLTPEKMSNIAKTYKKEKLIDDIYNLYSGKLITPDQHSLGRCIYQVNKMLAPYNVGFDMKTSREKKMVTSLDPKSKAFEAGLRNGQIIISIKEYPDNISKMTEIIVKDNNKIKLIKYYPYKGELKSIPQFELDQTKWQTDPQQCLAWFK